MWVLGTINVKFRYWVQLMLIWALGTIDFLLKVEEMTPALNAVQGVCHSTCHTKMATEELWW